MVDTLGQVSVDVEPGCRRGEMGHLGEARLVQAVVSER